MMENNVNYSELKAYVLKLYDYFERVFAYYFKDVNVCETNCPAYVINFLTQLIILKIDFDRLINNSLEKFTTLNIDLSEYDIYLVGTDGGINMLCHFWQNEILSKFFNDRNVEENSPYFDIYKILKSTEKYEMDVFSYIIQNPVRDSEKQTFLIQKVFGIDLKSEPIKFIEVPISVDEEKIKSELKSLNKKNENYGCILLGSAVITVLPAYILALLIEGDSSDYFIGWFIGIYIVLNLYGLLYVRYTKGEENVEYSNRQRGRSSGSAFWRGSRGRSLNFTWKIKKYDPEGWRKKNGTNLFKQTGRKRNSWF